jgi:eukaryotic-like serine/threonine-protein kinase
MTERERDNPVNGSGSEPVDGGAGAAEGRSRIETAELSPGQRGTRDSRVASAGGEQPGDVIGRYTLLEQIGTGGFGVVFLAEQHEPVARRVALKILKLGMDTLQIIARFEQERQTLALMDHPHIAKVLDAGTTESGRPYFVMELVSGEPITDVADALRLSVRQRLELFTQVCNAIRHAHQKGVIHRDIKPSNVLVSVHDGRPHAQVIDFGIAKAIAGATSAERSMHTRLGQFIGTPRYMSPEQGEGSADIDTRSDVYSLGVLLYQLLTGETPLDSASLENSPSSELQRLLREVDPPLPSSRVSASAHSRPLVAERRSTDPRKLSSVLRGELDWIAMKALEKDRHRRYDSAGALAQDVERYLAGQPVQAAPPSVSYRARKFVTRHRVPVVASMVVALALVGGLAGTLWQAAAAARERDAARRETARATALNHFMAQMLTASNPEAQGSREVTVLELLSKASTTATETLAGQPEAEAEARTLLGNTFRSLGEVDEAIEELERAVALRDQGAASETHGQAISLAALAVAHISRGDYQAAVPLLERGIRIVEGLGDAELDTLGVLHYDLANALQRLSRYEEAERELDRSEAAFDRLPGELPGKQGKILIERASLAKDWKGDLDQAEQLYTEALEMLRRSEEPWLVSDGLNSLAVIKASRDKLDEAIALHEESVAISRRVFGDDHPTIATQLENLGGVFLKRREHVRTLELLDQALAIRVSVYGADSFPVARTRFNMGVVAAESGDWQRSRELIDSVIPVFRQYAGERSVEVATGLIYRGRASEWLDSFDAALRDYDSAIAVIDSMDAPSVPMQLNVLMNLTRLHCRRGAPQEARDTAELARSLYDPESEDGKAWVGRFEQSLDFCSTGR